MPIEYDEDLALTDIPILVVDDNLDNLDLMETLLGGEGFEQVLLADTGQTALDLLEQQTDIGVVLLDLMMPEMDGYEVCRRIANNPKTHHIPVIVVTGGAFRQNEALLKSFAAGATDFIHKPLNEVELFSRLRVALKLYRERVLRRSSVRRIVENETRFRTLINQAPVGMAHVDRQGRFLLVNDYLCTVLGYDSQELLTHTLRGLALGDTDRHKMDTLLAEGSDRFLIEAHLKSKQNVPRWFSLSATRLLNAGLDGDTYVLIAEDFTEQKETAVKMERMAHYDALTHHPSETTPTQQRLSLEQDLWRSLDQGDFLLHYQPQIDLQSLPIVGMEVLLRWRHPKRGLLTPSAFLPLAEETGLIVVLGEWVIREACAQAKSWQKEGYGDLAVQVNLSARQLQQPEFRDQVELILKETELPSNGLGIEITESINVLGIDRIMATLQGFRELGIKIALDDFGMGYSSLNDLKRFPLDTLKIEKTFMQGALKNRGDFAVVQTIVALGRSLGLEICAEGIEDERLLDFAIQQGCDKAQGYLFSKPRSAEEITQLLQSGTLVKVSS